MTKYEPLFFDIETTGLNPLAEEWHNNVRFDAQVTAVGVGRIHNWREASDVDEPSYGVQVLYDEDEYRLLKVLNKRMNEKTEYIREQGKEPFLVTYNGRRYDHPYLGARYSRKRLECPTIISELRRLDMMRVYQYTDYLDSTYPSEDEVLEHFGVEVNDKHDGSDMPDLFEERNWAAIREHVDTDVEGMMRLFFETKNRCYQQFYDHYDIDSTANFRPTIE